jgi:hypothetical protein
MWPVSKYRLRSGPIRNILGCGLLITRRNVGHEAAWGIPLSKVNIPDGQTMPFAQSEHN